MGACASTPVIACTGTAAAGRACAPRARLPDPGWSVVLLATADDTEWGTELVRLVPDEVTGAAAGTCP